MWSWDPPPAGIYRWVFSKKNGTTNKNKTGNWSWFSKNSRVGLETPPPVSRGQGAGCWTKGKKAEKTKKTKKTARFGQRIVDSCNDLQHQELVNAASKN